MSTVFWNAELTGRPMQGTTNKYGYGSSGSSASWLKDWLGNKGTTPTEPGPPGFQWTFPQYSQDWAFTPPQPSQYRLPPQFDPKSSTGYLVPKSSSSSGSRFGSWPTNRSGSSSSSRDLSSILDRFKSGNDAMSLQDIWAKYTR